MTTKSLVITELRETTITALLDTLGRIQDGRHFPLANETLYAMATELLRRSDDGDQHKRWLRQQCEECDFVIYPKPAAGQDDGRYLVSDQRGDRDWREAVASGNTQLGYWEWVDANPDY